MWQPCLGHRLQRASAVLNEITSRRILMVHGASSPGSPRNVVRTHLGGPLNCSVYKVMFSTSSRDYVPDLDLETKFSLISTLKGWITPSPNHFRLFELNWIEFSQVISAIKLRMIPNALNMGITFFENLSFGSDTLCINESEIELLNFTIQTVLKYAFNFCA